MKKEKIISMVIDKCIFALTDQGRIMMSNSLSLLMEKKWKWIEIPLPDHNGDGLYGCEGDLFEED